MEAVEAAEAEGGLVVGVGGHLQGKHAVEHCAHSFGRDNAGISLGYGIERRPELSESVNHSAE